MPGQTRKGAILIIGIILIILAIWALDVAASFQNDRIIELSAVEVKEYEGQDLSSILDFRENSIRGPQQVDTRSYTLSVSGIVSDPKDYSYDEVLDRFPPYRKVLTLHCVEGWDATILWEGVRVHDILLDAGYDANATTVIFTAADGYSTSLPLSSIRDRDILLAYRMNGVVMPPERGYPFQLVAEDRWGYKWIKWVTDIEVSNDEGYRGYWESRGFSNDASIDRSFFGG